MDDTSLEIADKVREMFCKKTPAERFKIGCSMYETSKYLVIRSILENHPNISKAGLQKELFLKFYGDDFNLSEREKILSHIEKNFAAKN
jgi:hypothetical protein